MNLWLTVLYVLSSSAGLVFNGFILLVLLWQKRIHTANHLLLLHLAVVDTLFCFLILLVNTSIASIDPESLDDELQQPLRLQGVAWTVLPAVLIWTICGMSIDRYATVCYPFTHKTLVNRKRAGLLILTSWLIFICLSSVPFLGLCSYRFSPQRFAYTIQCFDRKFFNAELTFFLILVSSNFVLPVIIITSTQLHILVIARSQQGKIISALAQQRSFPVVGQKHGSEARCLSSTATSLKVSRGRSGFLLVSLLLASFACLWLPTGVLSLVETIKGHDAHPSLVSGANVLFTLIPSVNAYVYGVKSQHLRQTFKRLLQRYLYQHEATQEIDRRISIRSHSQSSTRFSLAWHSLTHPSSLPASLLPQRTRRRFSAPVISVTSTDHETKWPDETSSTGYRSVFRRFSTHTLLGTSGVTDSNQTRVPSPIPSHCEHISLKARSQANFLSFKDHDSKGNKTNLSPIEEVATHACNSCTELSAVAAGKPFIEDNSCSHQLDYCMQ